MPKTFVKTVAVAGANGELGGLIVKHLLQKGASVKALVRTPNESLKALLTTFPKQLIILQINYEKSEEIESSFEGVWAVVSALQGLDDVIITLQMQLLRAAINKQVSRFIPSDYAANFTRIIKGQNRNFDVRKAFLKSAGNEIRKSKSNIQVTSIFNGGFMELLTNPAFQMIDFEKKTVNYFGVPQTIQDFTTYDNTAEFTAFAAIDPNPTPTLFCVAGEQTSAIQLVELAKKHDSSFTLKKVMSIWALKKLIGVIQVVAPGKSGEVLPLWQKLQYGLACHEGLASHDFLDNHFYPVKWTKIDALLGEAIKSEAAKQELGGKSKGSSVGLGIPLAVGALIAGAAAYFYFK